MAIPWKSKLNPYKNEILDMWKDRITLPEIQAFLKDKEIEISQQGIWKFIKVRTQKKNPHDIVLPDVKPLEKVETNSPLEKRKNIPEAPTHLMTQQTSSDINNTAEEEQDHQIHKLRERLKKKAHADPLAGLFIRKRDKG